MNILNRFTARWLVGLLVVLTVLSHLSDAGRVAQSGFGLGQAVLSSGDLRQPVLASEAPQGEIRFRAGDRQPHVGGKPAGDAVISSARLAEPQGAPLAPDSREAPAPVRSASFAPGQRAPPAVLPKA
ncbi:hypothetical protein [Aquibium sp. ELW1220]|uniref:hypothetical protein n=1 Tax=Aquibium sp. ELW1220 TaxID=2976766 RepID=UPI0025B25530|nr:hypothetical protein [Aquibium sp. ELW1220]MDN2581957.1 hypothetical protein [Aquibium sp. ELW1220]